MKLTVGSVLFLGVLTTAAAPAFADHHAVKIASKEAVGAYLTDTRGMALYWFTKDTSGKSKCSGPCLERWPLYYREAVQPPEGVRVEDFGTIVRDDGQKQTTFRGFPLYYWFRDATAGDTLGQGVSGAWYVIDPAHFPPQ